MALQLNVGDHVSSEAGYVAIPPTWREMVRWARTRANAVARGMPSANTYFRGLPGGRTLTALLADSSIWVNYSPSLGDWGETNAVGGKEIALGGVAFRTGRWSVLATMIHELAHSNGAPGGASQDAERAVLACGLGRLSERSTGVDDPRTPFNPGIGG
jgi:hypothetical protein